MLRLFTESKEKVETAPEPKRKGGVLLRVSFGRKRRGAQPEPEPEAEEEDDLLDFEDEIASARKKIAAPATPSPVEEAAAERPGVHFKTYFSNSIAAAMKMASEELGDDAVLVHSRRTTPENRSRGAYEVVFGLEQKTQPAPAKAVEPVDDFEPEPEPKPAAMRPTAPAAVAPPPPPPPAPVAPPVVEPPAAMRGAVRKPTFFKGPKIEASLQDPALDGGAVTLAMQRSLRAGDLSEDEIEELLFAVNERLGTLGHAPVPAFHKVERERTNHQRRTPTEAEWWTSLRMEMLCRIRVNSNLEQRVTVLVGPPGAGKTTALLKLAVREGLEKHRRIHIVSLDNYRVGASEQLKHYAEMMGVPFTLADDGIALDNMLRRIRDDRLVLVDTAGYGPRDLDPAAELARSLVDRDDTETHLVLPVSMRPNEIARAVDRFEIFNPARLLFTMLDDSECRGVMYREAARTRKPVSFLSSGQGIPDDFQPAGARSILEPFFAEKWLDELP